MRRWGRFLPPRAAAARGVHPTEANLTNGRPDPTPEPPEEARSAYDRIREHKLAQWAVAYLAGAWVLLQGTTLVGQHFSWPAWIHRSLIAVAAVGLVATLVIAWYHGEKGRQRVSGPELLMLAALLLVAGAAVSVAKGGPGVATSPRAGSAGDDPASASARSPSPDRASAGDPADDPARRSIAVLPFQNLSQDEANEYFSDGITEDVLAALAKIGDLHVISRTSSMTYKDTEKTLREIGRELGVGTILEGSVRRQGDRVRIVAQLVDARDDRHLWSETYDREMTDLFAIQTEIAEAIAAALEAELTEAERERILAGGTENLDAYELYLRGRERLREPGPDGWQEATELAIAHFRRALELDSEYALAHAGLSLAFTRRQEYRGVAWGDSAILSASRAISLDPQAAEGYVALARAQDIWGLADLAAGNLRLALERNPNHAEAVAAMADLLEVSGRLDGALDWALRAAALEPTYAPHYDEIGWILHDLGADDAALRWLERRRELAPDDPRSHTNFAYHHLYRGRIREAEEHLERARSLDPDAIQTLQAGAEFALVGGDLETAAELLARLYERYSEQWWTRELLGWTYTRLGRPEEAADPLRQAEETALLWAGRGDQGAWLPEVLAVVHLARGETEEAIARLEEAVARGARSRAWLRRMPMFEPLRGDPRFTALLERLDEELARMRTSAGADTVMPPDRAGAARR